MRAVRVLTLAVLATVLVAVRVSFFDPEAITLGSSVFAFVAAACVGGIAWTLITPLADFFEMETRK